MTAIVDIVARQILDSRGNPTVEVDVVLESGARGRAAVPSGASTGAYEAYERRDGGARFGGKGVQGAVDAVNSEIRAALTGWEALDQKGVDTQLIDLDGTDNKARLGANAILGVSMAVAKGAADELDQPLYRYLGGVHACVLPLPLMNVLNGGAHAFNTLELQEFMVAPMGAASFSEALRWGAEIYHVLNKLLKARNLSTAVGDEGGYAPDLPSNEDAIVFLEEAIAAAGYRAGEQIAIALDVAATELWDGKTYNYKDGKRTSADQVEFLADLQKRFDIVSIEDGLAEDDWDGWIELTKRIGDRCLIVGDDLFTTSPERVQEGITRRAGNAVLVKPNQIGTLTRTVETIQLAHEHGFKTIISHRSGETTDDAIAHIGAAFGCFGIKTGAVGGERTAKLNELIRIEEEL